MVRIIHGRADDMLRGHASASLSYLTTLHLPNTLLETAKHLERADKDNVTLEEIPMLDVQRAAVEFMKVVSYMAKNFRRLSAYFLGGVVRDDTRHLVTSRNLLSNKVQEHWRDTIYICNNMPFSLAFRLVPHKRKGIIYEFCFGASISTSKGKLYMVGSTKDKNHYLLTQHCYDRLYERFGLGGADVLNAKELYAVNMFTSPKLVVDDGAHLVFEDFMCLGGMLVEGLYFFKTIITKPMYTDKQRSFL